MANNKLTNRGGTQGESCEPYGEHNQFTLPENLALLDFRPSQTLGNQPPVVTAGSSTLSYTENAAPTRLAVDGTISDVDSVNFAGGYLRARVTVNSQATDQLSILNTGSITTNAAGQVLSSGIVFGTFAGGSGANLFTVSLNASATVARVQALLRNLSFSSSSNNPSTAQRTIVIQVGDGDGAQGAIARKN